MTNAERIRTMTVDELAELMDALNMDDIDYAKTFCDMCNGQYECEDCRRWWLGQDADDCNGLNKYSFCYLPPREDIERETERMRKLDKTVSEYDRGYAEGMNDGINEMKNNPEAQYEIGYTQGQIDAIRHGEWIKKRERNYALVRVFRVRRGTAEGWVWMESIQPLLPVLRCVDG